MKKFIKGVRFTPSNYPDEIEDKIQKYRKQGYKLLHARYSAHRNKLKVPVKVQRSTQLC